jgi:hypothetical protein
LVLVGGGGGTHKYLFDLFLNSSFSSAEAVFTCTFLGTMFKTPSTKYTIDVSIMIFDSCFLYYQLFNLLCSPTLIAFSQDSLYLIPYLYW